MTKSRIEVNESGELVTVIPEELIQELVLSEGDVIEWSEDSGEVILTFG